MGLSHDMKMSLGQYIVSFVKKYLKNISACKRNQERKQNVQQIGITNITYKYQYMGLSWQ